MLSKRYLQQFVLQRRITFQALRHLKNCIKAWIKKGQLAKVFLKLFISDAFILAPLVRCKWFCYVIGRETKLDSVALFMTDLHFAYLSLLQNKPSLILNLKLSVKTYSFYRLWRSVLYLIICHLNNGSIVTNFTHIHVNINK